MDQSTRLTKWTQKASSTQEYATALCDGFQVLVYTGLLVKMYKPYTFKDKSIFTFQLIQPEKCLIFVHLKNALNYYLGASNYFVVLVCNQYLSGIFKKSLKDCESAASYHFERVN